MKLLTNILILATTLLFNLASSSSLLLSGVPPTNEKRKFVVFDFDETISAVTMASRSYMTISSGNASLGILLTMWSRDMVKLSFPQNGLAISDAHIDTYVERFLHLRTGYVAGGGVVDQGLGSSDILFSRMVRDPKLGLREVFEAVRAYDVAARVSEEDMPTEDFVLLPQAKRMANAKSVFEPTTEDARKELTRAVANLFFGTENVDAALEEAVKETLFRNYHIDRPNNRLYSDDLLVACIRYAEVTYLLRTLKEEGHLIAILTRNVTGNHLFDTFRSSTMFAEVDVFFGTHSNHQPDWGRPFWFRRLGADGWSAGGIMPMFSRGMGNAMRRGNGTSAMLSALSVDVANRDTPNLDFLRGISFENTFLIDDDASQSDRSLPAIPAQRFFHVAKLGGVGSYLFQVELRITITLVHSSVCLHLF